VHRCAPAFAQARFTFSTRAGGRASLTHLPALFTCPLDDAANRWPACEYVYFFLVDLFRAAHRAFISCESLLLPAAVIPPFLFALEERPRLSSEPIALSLQRQFLHALEETSCVCLCALKGMFLRPH
jgi:hypothetical protein